MNTIRHGSMLFVLLLVFLATTETPAADVAQIKVSTGAVFSYDRSAQAGRKDTARRRGTLSVASGKLGKQSPDAVTVRTPSTILGVRGTEFLVRAGE